MATIDGTKKKLTVRGELIESAVSNSHEHSNKTVLEKLSDNNGTLQYNGSDITGGGSGSYTLPTASTTELGGVKVDGTTITVNPEGVISATGGSEVYLSFSDTNVDRSVSTVLNDTEVLQEYVGGLIEIQPDSWDGDPCATDDTTKLWGFPVSLDILSQKGIRDKVFNGNGTGLMFIRLPLGFAYRGYRNIDETTSLAKNIGERFKGQNKALKALLQDVAEIGGGLYPEYWCPAPYWTTGGAYYNTDVTNYITAGGSYDRTTALYTIKSTDETQYNAQIEAFTNAIIDDLEYLHQNVAPVRMFALQNEPDSGHYKYGACRYTDTEYSDIMEVLVPKINDSTLLSTYNDEPNTVKIIVASRDKENPFGGIGSTFMANHPDWIWGYAHHLMRNASGENTNYEGAEWFKTDNFATNKGNRTNVFINEYEYFVDDATYPDDYRCANNMLRMIYELIYSEAKTVMPIIHLCKPLGQTLAATNTRGYALYITNLKEENYGVDIFGNANSYGLPRGKVAPNKWAYNSWSLIGDNLPVGAYLVGNYADQLYKCGYAAYKHEGKLYLFFANCSDKDAKISIQFVDSKKFNGKYYDLNNCGNQIVPKEGSVIDFVIPAMSGQCWIENTSNVVKGVPVSEQVNLFSEIGGINVNNGKNETSTTRARTDFIPVPTGLKNIRVDSTIDSSKLRHVIRFYDSNKTFLGSGTNNFSNGTVYVNAIPTGAAYMRLLFIRNQTEATISYDDFIGKKVQVHSTMYTLYNNTLETIPVTGVAFDSNTYTVTKGNTITVNYTVSPTNATNKNALITANNSNVSISGNTITGVSVGTSILTVTTADGGYTATTTVTIEDVPDVAVTGVTIDETATVEVGKTTQLNYTVSPTNATNKTVAFSVDNSNCTVSTTGVVTGVTEGTSVITITTDDGSFTDTCTVTISAASSGGDIDADTLLTFEQANTLMLDADNWLSGQYNTNGAVEENTSRCYFTYKVAINPSTTYGVCANSADYKLIIREMKSDGTLAFNRGFAIDGSTATSYGNAAYLLISIYKPTSGSVTSDNIKALIADGTLAPTVHYV